MLCLAVVVVNREEAFVGRRGSFTAEVRRVLFDIGISLVSTCIITL